MPRVPADTPAGGAGGGGGADGVGVFFSEQAFDTADVLAQGAATITGASDLFSIATLSDDENYGTITLGFFLSMTDVADGESDTIQVDVTELLNLHPSLDGGWILLMGLGVALPWSGRIAGSPARGVIAQGELRDMLGEAITDVLEADDFIYSSSVQFIVRD